MQHTLLTWIVAGALFGGIPSALAERGGTAFPQVFRTEAGDLPLRGSGVLRVGMIFKVYAAALYLTGDAAWNDYTNDIPKRIEIAYLRDLDADILVRAGNDALARHLGAAERAALRERIDAINRLYVDVKAGDRYALTYFPGRGSTLALNGRDLGTIDGADFAAAYFGIWLDARTGYPEFHAALTGSAK